MKTIIRTIALSVLISASSLAYAEKNNEKIVSPELNVQIQASTSSSVIIKFDKLEGELVKIKIYDTNGELIYSDKKSEGSNYAKLFDLSAFPAGKYAYSVSNDLYSVKKTIEIK